MRVLHSQLSSHPLGANDPKSGLSNLSTDVSAAVTQSWHDNVMLEAGAGWVLGLGFEAGF